MDNYAIKIEIFINNEKNMSYRSNRFLIDRIDARLGSLENELKFDKIMIATSSFLFVVLILGVILLAESHPIASLFCGLGSVFFLMLAYMMFKEYRNDLKRKVD